MSTQHWKTWWHKHRIESLVFLTGGIILVVEVTATRVLSPYYGNTIYTVSSVLSVVLGALALGYYRGGKEADDHPSHEKFFMIIWKSGIALFVVYLFIIAVLPVGGYFFSLAMGPLIWSLILFFVPSYLLGKLSPFAIKLAHNDDSSRGLGALSGGIFFWSTTGSILGSLLSGFVLIPVMGVSAILATMTALLIATGGAGLVSNGRKTYVVNTIMLVILICFVFWASKYATDDPRIRYARDGMYEQLRVIDIPYAGHPARFFLQDKSTSGGMFLDSDEHATDYTKYYALFKLWKPDLKNALVIGGGVYTIPKALHRDRPEATIDVVDIEPGLEALAKKYFALPDTPLIRSYTADGRRFLHDAETPYDLIVSDVYYSLYSIPSHFTTREFFTIAYAQLAPHGVFLANVIGGNDLSKDRLLASEVRTMREVFPHILVFRVSADPEDSMSNYMLVGLKDDSSDPADFSARALRSDDPFIRTLPAHLVPLDTITSPEAMTLTDDHAPIEALIGETMRQVPKMHAANSEAKNTFSGEGALERIKAIVALGTRAIDTAGNAALRDMIKTTLAANNIEPEVDSWTHTRRDGTTVELHNIIGRIAPEKTRRIILGTHYDSIVRAYRDRKDPNAYMPGANNSASGVALLLESTSHLTALSDKLPFGIDLVFFDGEEGELALGEGDTHWSPLGSTHFVSSLAKHYGANKPEAMIDFDMICDADLRLVREYTSMQKNEVMVNDFWNVGHAIAPDAFPLSSAAMIGDDHTPFLTADIPAMLVIDFDYGSYNTQEDTPDKCSAKSLQTVGDTLLTYLKTVR